MYCVCWCDLDPIQGQGHGPFDLPTIAHNCTFLGLSPPPLLCEAQNWWLIVIIWDLAYSLSEPDFRIYFLESYHDIANFAECRYFTKFKWPYLSTADTTVTSLGTLVVLHVLCMLMWPGPDSRSGSRSQAFELPTISEAVHAGSDDHSPLAGLSGYYYFVFFLYPR